MSLQSIFCRHQWYWSERHGAERCRDCGKVSDGSSGLIAGDLAPQTAPAAPARPFLLASQMRARTLSERLELLAEGAELTRDEILQTVSELIEEAQTARPQLSANEAAHHFAALSGARNLHA